MGQVIEIGISTIKGNKIENVIKIEAVKGKGLLNDRKFQENNQKNRQITLIEIENIIHFNTISQTKILPIDFRRNIVTKDIKLNDLLGKEFFVGKIKLKAHDLCKPCKYLQDKLKQNNFIKEFMYTGGLRCEILNSGTINVGDKIKYK